MKALQIVLLFAQNMTILDLPSLLQVQSYPSLDNQSFSLYAKEYVMCYMRSKTRDIVVNFFGVSLYIVNVKWHDFIQISQEESFISGQFL